MLAAAAVPCLADALVERGDVLSVTVFEDPTLGREAKVNVDGQILLPHLGAIEAAGSDVATIRQRIEQELARRDIILRPTVLVDVVRHRPFYVGGAVAQPGAVEFEPGLTVRHAILLAGGVDRTEDVAAPTSAELDAIRSKLRTGSVRLLQAESLIARLTAELDRTPRMIPADPGTAPVAAEDAAQIRDLDSSLLGDRVAEWSASQARLHDEVNLLARELEILDQQIALQKEDAEIQQALVKSTQELYDKGLVPLPRLQDLQREATRLSRDLLETEAFAARALQERTRADHALAASETLWRIETRRALREAEVERNEIRAEIGLLTNQLLAAGLALGPDGVLERPVETVTIHRVVGGTAETIAATMATEIRPGDVIEVAFSRRPDG